MRIVRIGLFPVFLALLAPMALSAQTEQPVAASEQPVAASGQFAAEVEQRLGPETGYPLPRFVSLRASEANARRGPSPAHRIDWVFTRRNMPMMVVAEYGHWRRVIDRDGAGGWMHYSLLSGERTAIVVVDLLPIYSRPDTTSVIRANAEMGVTGALDECMPGWCLMEVGGYRGWVDASSLWGVEPGETFE